MVVPLSLAYIEINCQAKSFNLVRKLDDDDDGVRLVSFTS